jgi:transposase
MGRMTKGLLPLMLLMAALLLIRGLPRAAVRHPRMDTKALSGIVWREGRARIGLNHADAALLASIPGIGPVLAARIEAFVREKGALEAPKELLNVAGIGPAKLREIEKIAEAD